MGVRLIGHNVDGRCLIGKDIAAKAFAHVRRLDWTAKLMTTVADLDEPLLPSA